MIWRNFMRKYPLLLIFTGVALGFVFLVLLGSPQNVQAQCGQPTQCNTCHNIQGELPVHENGAWHIDHMPYNACHVCHGGNKEAAEANVAHTSILTNLDQMQSACAECHSSADLLDSYSQYASQLGISSEIDPDQVQSGSSSGLNGKLNTGQTDLPGSGSVNTKETAPNQTGNLILSIVLVVSLLGGGSYVYSNERRLHKQSQIEGSLLAWIWTRLRKENWSPYAAGILLGITAILAVAIGDHLLSASGGIATIASSLFSTLPAETTSNNIYFKFIYPPGLGWPVVLLIGVFIGGLLSSLTSGTFRLRWNDDPTWNKVFGSARWKRFVIGFFGAVILQFGASIAGGCTSGLAISGGMLLAPSAFLFMAGMFASGILVAILIYRRRY
jgi:hypothetical protein